VSPGLVFLGCEEVDWEPAAVLGEKCCTAKLAPKGLVEHGKISLDEWLEVHGPITRPGRCIPCEGWEPEPEPEELKDCRLEWRMSAKRSNAGRLTLMRGNRPVAKFDGYSGYSGKLGTCGPESQCITCLGPVPEGTHRAAGWFTKYGQPAMWIRDGFCAGRGAFQIHKGGRGGSRGCIVLPAEGMTQLKEEMKRRGCPDSVPLDVSYTIHSEGDCPRGYFPLETISWDCIRVRPGPHKCNVGCAPHVLGPPQLGVSTYLAVVKLEGPHIESCH